MHIGLASHCTIDTIQISDSSFDREGGPVLYGGLTAKRFKFDVTIQTKFGNDFPIELFQKNDLKYTHSLSEKPTTRFLINIINSDRIMHLTNLCEPVEFTSGNFDGFIVSPVFNEISSNTFEEIKKDTSFMLVDPQGFLRRTDDKNEIYLSNTEINLSNVSALKANPREMSKLVGQNDDDGLKLVQKKGVEYVLLTDKQQISLLVKDRVYSISLPNISLNDTTGIGDIFCSSFCCTMIKERDFLWALCFAGGAAQAALETREVGLNKIPKKGAIETNASYFYNTVKFRQI